MTHPTPATVLQQEADLLEAGIALQTQGLQLLLAEMRALAAMMPTGDLPDPQDQATDASIEASFDNMPV